MLDLVAVVAEIAVEPERRVVAPQTPGLLARLRTHERVVEDRPFDPDHRDVPVVEEHRRVRLAAVVEVERLATPVRAGVQERVAGHALAILEPVVLEHVRLEVRDGPLQLVPKNPPDGWTV